MVVRVEEALEKLSKGQNNELKTLEKKIDRTILEEFDGDSLTLSVDYLGEMVLKKLKEMYAGAGWNVKYESDQRDGDYLLITPRRKR